MTKIVFMGSPEFALPSLRALSALGGYSRSTHEGGQIPDEHVVGVVTQPDRASGRGPEHPVEGEEAPSSSWCRIATSMAGKDRGLVMIPDKGTEVVMGFAYRTMTPYVLAGVYNGAADKPEPYHNDDKKNNLRVFWSRNDHLLILTTPAAPRR